MLAGIGFVLRLLCGSRNNRLTLSRENEVGKWVPFWGPAQHNNVFVFIWFDLQQRLHSRWRLFVFMRAAARHLLLWAAAFRMRAPSGHWRTPSLAAAPANQSLMLFALALALHCQLLIMAEHDELRTKRCRRSVSEPQCRTACQSIFPNCWELQSTAAFKR